MNRKNFLDGLLVLVFGFLLLNVTFAFYGAIAAVLSILFPKDIAQSSPIFMPLMVGAISIGVLAASFFLIFKSEFKDLYKASIMMVPTAILLAVPGALLSQYPFFVFLAGALVVVGIFSFLYLKKMSWLYYLSVSFVTIGLLLIVLTGTDI